MGAGVDFVNNTGSGFKVALGGGVQQAGGVVASETVAHRLQRCVRMGNKGEGARLASL